jgi:hypothetical protein
MTQYQLALRCGYAVSLHPQQTQQVSAGVNALGGKLPDAVAFVGKTGLLAAESTTAARLTKEVAS